MKFIKLTQGKFGLVDDADNTQNHKPYENNSSGDNGVQRYGKKWWAQIGVDEKDKHLGTFKTQADAKEARCLGEIKYWTKEYI